MTSLDSPQNTTSICMLKPRQRSRIRTGISTSRFATSIRTIQICIIDINTVATTLSADNGCFATARVRIGRRRYIASPSQIAAEPKTLRVAAGGNMIVPLGIDQVELGSKRGGAAAQWGRRKLGPTPSGTADLVSFSKVCPIRLFSPSYS